MRLVCSRFVVLKKMSPKIPVIFLTEYKTFSYYRSKCHGNDSYEAFPWMESRNIIPPKLTNFCQWPSSHQRTTSRGIVQKCLCSCWRSLRTDRTYLHSDCPLWAWQQWRSQKTTLRNPRRRILVHQQILQGGEWRVTRESDGKQKTRESAHKRKRFGGESRKTKLHTTTNPSGLWKVQRNKNCVIWSIIAGLFLIKRSKAFWRKRTKHTRTKFLLSIVWKSLF